jgi:hypothetical protein
MKMVVNMQTKMSISITTFLNGFFNNNRSEPLPFKREEFSRWLTGFIDGKGNFKVYFDKNLLKVMFIIRVHIDDIAVLYKIKYFLNIGIIKIEGNSCLFIINDENSLFSVLFPLLDKDLLYTTKWLDYHDFKSVVYFILEENTIELNMIHLE